MPAIDSLHDNKIHIADRNRHQAERSLCGVVLQAAPYYEEQRNFNKASCITCLKMYFGVNYQKEVV